VAQARSNYRQVRLTVTEEAGGWITVRIMCKPLSAGWQMKDTVYHHRFRVDGPTPHWLDLLAHAYRAVGMEALPYGE
jgi:hypothetical protein